MFKSIIIAIFFLYGLVSCSQKGMSNFLEISESGQSPSAEAKLKSSNKDTNGSAQVARTRPLIESTTDWKTVEKQLPKDNFTGDVDWSAALKEGVISPRRAIVEADDSNSVTFNYDFYLPGPRQELDAYFPHSVHTEWLQCANCHPKIFRTRGVKMTMADMYAGKFCGTCHGSVAFGLNACLRCHTGMEGAKK